MYINRALIKGYKNFYDESVELDHFAVIIGLNNKGKSNLIEALSLPFYNGEISFERKNLYVEQLNERLKTEFWEKLDTIEIDDLIVEMIPSVQVSVELKFEETEAYYFKELLSDDLDSANLTYYFKVKESKLDELKSLLKELGSNFGKYERMIISKNFFEYKIINKFTGRSVSFDVWRNLQANIIKAERDDFSSTGNKLKSQALSNLFKVELSNIDIIELEKTYSDFIESQGVYDFTDKIINFVDSENKYGLSDFFNEISIKPNLPSHQSLSENVQLQVNNNSISSNGLGYRNIINILILVMYILKEENQIPNVLMIEEPEAHLSADNINILMNLLVKICNNSKNQVIVTTHSKELINRLNGGDLSVINDSGIHRLKNIYTQVELRYAMKIRNFDMMNFLVSPRLILVEGITEELLIKSFLYKEQTVNEVTVVNFQKGYKKLIKLWVKINKDTSNKLAIIRDYDNEPNAQEEHELLVSNYHNIFCSTTSGYTLEDDLIDTQRNLELIMSYINTTFNRSFNTRDDVLTYWKAKKADTMFDICEKLILNDKATSIIPSDHIVNAISFIKGQE